MVHSLKKSCIFTLIQYRSCLSDIGYLNVDSLQDILFHCSPEELDRIEVATDEGSNRDLTWYTWHIWLNHFRVKYGDPVEGFQPPVLPEPCPEDYSPPVGDFPEPGDWKEAFMDKQRAAQQKMERVGGRLQELYKQKEQEKASRNIQVCNIVPSKGRRRSSAPAPGLRPAKRPAASPLEAKNAKMLKALGLARRDPKQPTRVTITHRTVPRTGLLTPPPRPAAPPPRRFSAPSGRPAHPATPFTRLPFTSPQPRPAHPLSNPTPTRPTANMQRGNGVRPKAKPPAPATNSNTVLAAHKQASGTTTTRVSGTSSGTKASILGGSSGTKARVSGTSSGAKASILGGSSGTKARVSGTSSGTKASISSNHGGGSSSGQSSSMQPRMAGRAAMTAGQGGASGRASTMDGGRMSSKVLTGNPGAPLAPVKSPLGGISAQQRAEAARGRAAARGLRVLDEEGDDW